VPPALLGLRHGALNLHPSLLPRHRGATPIPAAILAGDAETGVTLMRMDEGLDTGPIVAQTRTPIDDMETAAELEARLAIEAADLLERSLGPWLRRELEARSQSVDGATVTRPFRREDGRLDISRPTIEVARQLRAHQPWPGSFVDTAVGRLIIWKWAWGFDGPAHGVFGPAGLGVHGSQLLLEDVQPAGGRRMAWDAFVRGRPGILGSAALASEP
jgi:methionyl-tRNA formyltransferase